jgi:hypothetical protein
MKTIPLRQLVREPLKVKRWTRAGKTVQVTDNGEPLWTIQATLPAGNENERRHGIDELLDEVLREPRSHTSATRLLEESRR